MNQSQPFVPATQKPRQASQDFGNSTEELANCDANSDSSMEREKQLIAGILRLGATREMDSYC